MQYSDVQVKELEQKAKLIRRLIIQMLAKSGSGHPGGSLSATDLITALFFSVLEHNPKDQTLPGRDRFHMSKGHCGPLWYAVLAESGYFPKDKLMTLRQLGSILQGHPDRRAPGIEVASGSLGQGLSVGIGLAYALQLKKKSNRVWVMMSDGEQEEGSTWEAVMLAAKYKLDNLTGIIDRNNIQIDGYTEDIMPLDDLKNKYESFNWQVLEINGNNIREFVEACAKAETIHEKPTVIIAHTIPGKGVDFMENKFEWHGKPPSKEEAQIALRELRTLQGQIEAGHMD